MQITLVTKKGVLHEPHREFFQQHLRNSVYDILLQNQNMSISHLKKQGFDVFHPTYYEDYFLNYLRGVPFVLTIYDMIHELFPEHYINDKTSMLKEKLFHLASQVIAISEITKRDIMEIYNVSGENISVVHLADSLIDLNGTSQTLREKLPKRYIFFVGERTRYKNFQFFVKAIAGLLKQDQNLQLVCSGAPFNKSELDLFDFLSIAPKISHYFASDAELKCLYSNAEAFIFPSLYEGFGIPGLEAFACNCPVLLSQSGALPEIGGEAAIFFNPKSALEISNAVKKVIYDSNLRQTLIQKGKERLRLFSWNNTVKKTIEVYKKCL